LKVAGTIWNNKNDEGSVVVSFLAFFRIGGRERGYKVYLSGKVEVLSEVVNTFGGKDVLRRWDKKGERN